jgi:polyhydroxybutyrate depolymerase
MSLIRKGSPPPWAHRTEIGRPDFGRERRRTCRSANFGKWAGLFAIVIACLLAGCGSSPLALKVSASERAAGLKTVNLMSAGRRRIYLLYVPPGDSARRRLPLVLVYHGAYDTAADIANESGLLALAERRQNMIVAFLQGYEDSWNDDAGDPPAEAHDVDDVAFTKAVLAEVESSHFVDMRRVVATGISNGAIFVELLGCRAAANLTLTVPVEGQMAPTFSHSCRLSKPMSVYEIHATADPAIPYGGGTFGGYGGPVTVLSAHASVARWAALDRCSARASTTRTPGNVFTKYTGCRSGVSVTLRTIEGGAHVWPPGFATSLSRLVASLPPTTPKAVKP